MQIQEVGVIVLGVVEEKGTNRFKVEGIKNCSIILKDFWNTINNKSKININILSDKDVKTINIEELQVIVITVPRATRTEKPVYDFYRRIIGRLTMDLEVPFALDKDMFRVDTTPIHKAVREALVNSLVHANYIEGGSISIEKGFNYFKFENPGNLRIPFEIANVVERATKEIQLYIKCFL